MADVSKMYRAVELTEKDKDFHRFVWRNDPNEPLRDCRMTRVTFGISASSFAANMAMRQNALDFASKYPSAAEVVNKSLYVDDCLTGAETVDEARKLQIELQALFGQAKFLLRKWNTSDPSALDHVPSDLRESPASQVILDTPRYTKTLGIEWESRKDVFRLAIAEIPASKTLTKRLLVSDLAKTFDVLGWISPSTIKAKILLQRLWERKVIGTRSYQVTFWMSGTAGDLSFTSSLTSTCPAATSRRELKHVKCSYTGFATPQRTRSQPSCTFVSQIEKVQSTSHW